LAGEAVRGALKRLAIVVLLLGSGAGASDSSEPSAPTVLREPSGVVELSARTLQRSAVGSKSRVTIELSIVSRHDLPTVRLEGSLLGGPGFDETLGIPDRVLALAAGSTRKLRYTVELDRGRQHHLLFTARSDARDGPSHDTSTYLRINLDRTLEPEDLGHVLQYRARMSGGGEP
jgi:hypothetical protein